MPDDKLTQALQAVRLYYFQDMTMDAIARELGTSRSTVSRLITYARGSGLIEFRLHNPQQADVQLEQQLRCLFGVVAHVVPVPGSASEGEVRDRVSKFAARLVSSMFDSHMVLAVAWGGTVMAVSRHLTAKPLMNTQVVQLNGAGNTQTTGINYASQIVDRFCDAFGARAQQFPVPTFFDHPETKAWLWQERSVQRILDLQRRADLALFSIGAMKGDVPSHVYTGGYLEEPDFAELAEQGVVGDIATVFLREDGTYDGISLNERSSGPDPQVLRRMRHRICVAVGVHRVPGLLAALAAGLVTDLVVDTETAVVLLERAATQGWLQTAASQ